jgi:hypothetical protein
MFSFFDTHIRRLNDSKFFAGIVMLMLNVGSKYVQLNLSDTQESYLKYSLARELLIFSIVWMGTHDIYMSIMLTAAFVILANYLFNEDSSFCIMPTKFRKLRKSIDKNNDGIITDTEVNNAISILEKAKTQREEHRNMNLLNYFHSTKD